MPRSASPKQQTTDQVPLSRLVGPAVPIGVSEQAAADPGYLLAPADASNLHFPSCGELARRQSDRARAPKLDVSY